MNIRILLAFLSGWLLVLSPPAAAQNRPGDITFTMPVNLTHLFSDITVVRLRCSVDSTAILVNRSPATAKSPAGTIGFVANVSGDVPVSDGQVVTTLTTTVSVAGVLDNPSGQTAHYHCELEGASTSLQRWGTFNQHFQDTPYFKLTPSAITQVDGTFAW
jgi:hypothetical protein